MMKSVAIIASVDVEVDVGGSLGLPPELRLAPWVLAHIEPLEPSRTPQSRSPSCTDHNVSAFGSHICMKP